MIDEKKLIEGIETIFFGFVVDDNLSIREKLLEYINSQPTAYDVEKVINKLESKMFSAELHGDEWSGQTVDNLLCMGDVYEIVKGGGVDE